MAPCCWSARSARSSNLTCALRPVSIRVSQRHTLALSGWKSALVRACSSCRVWVTSGDLEIDLHINIGGTSMTEAGLRTQQRRYETGKQDKAGLLDVVVHDADQSELSRTSFGGPDGLIRVHVSSPPEGAQLLLPHARRCPVGRHTREATSRCGAPD